LNPFALPGDADGAPTWNNLLADLRELLLRARPEVIVLPHPTLDPHPDHICAGGSSRSLKAWTGSDRFYWLCQPPARQRPLADGRYR
jgi:LmbE family N-acetylglucosaminyl deacetylase